MANASPDSALIKMISDELAAAADPALAPGMQAYMKSEMPYLGVRVPVVRTITRAAERTRRPDHVDQLIATATSLWRQATHREHRYAATSLTDTARARAIRSPAMLPMLTEMITTGAWWDHVDDLAHRVGELLMAYPADIEPTVRQWILADDRWLKRVSIICQLGAKERTNLSLLADAIGANSSHPDFFVRKGIGWALREYARTDPTWVRDFVGSHAAELSPLSKREALKHL
jgi:3-methyladenine DNA glycosylase AlkD